MEQVKSKWKTWHKVVLGIIVIFFGLMAIAVNSSDKNVSTESSSSAVNTPSKVIEVTATKLFKDYNENEVAADEIYKGKELNISGTVESINKDFTNDIYILLITGDFQTVHCDMTDESKSAASVLKKGQRVTISGIGNGMLIGSPMVKDCTIK